MESVEARPDAVDWYSQWVSLHCGKLGQGEHGTVYETLRVNRDTLVGRHRAGAAELAEVTMRLAASGRPVKWANEHLPEVVTELRRLREDAADEARNAVPVEVEGPSCEVCGGCGWVTVPHPSCVWQGRVVVPRGRRGIITTAVTCDRCPKGQAEQDAERRRDDEDGRRVKIGRRLSEREYMRLIGGADGNDLYRQYLADQADDARAAAKSGTMPALYAGLLARLRPAPR